MNRRIRYAEYGTEKSQNKMPGAFEDMQEISYKLVYIPFEYTEYEWEVIAGVN